MADPKCPKCSYPYGAGGPYFGIYDPTKPCDGCGWDQARGEYTLYGQFQRAVATAIREWRNRRQR